MDELNEMIEVILSAAEWRRNPTLGGESPVRAPVRMGGGGGRRGDRSPANFSVFNIMTMGGAWKESTSNGPRPPPPQSPRRAAALAGADGHTLPLRIMACVFQW